jgi:hypothetical protein
MNRAETEDGSYASARNRKLLAAWAAKAGENEYAEPALNPCQTTAFEFFTDDELVNLLTDSAKLPQGFSEDLSQLSDGLVDLAMLIVWGRVRPGLLGY